MSKPRRTALVTEETRRLILRAAEAEFADRGFAAARLEDMAERVGITRAAVIYHFRDKQTLYQAVLEAVFTALTDRIQERMAEEVGYVEQVEGMIDTWIEFSGERPTLARIFMREVADAQHGFRPEVERLVSPLFARIIAHIDGGRREGAFRALDPNHLVTILAGATTWYATSASLLAGRPTDAETELERFEAYRAELMRVTRFLLGTSSTQERDS